MKPKDYAMRFGGDWTPRTSSFENMTRLIPRYSRWECLFSPTKNLKPSFPSSRWEPKNPAVRFRFSICIGWLFLCRWNLLTLKKPWQRDAKKAQTTPISTTRIRWPWGNFCWAMNCSCEVKEPRQWVCEFGQFLLRVFCDWPALGMVEFYSRDPFFKGWLGCVGMVTNLTFWGKWMVFDLTGDIYIHIFTSLSFGRCRPTDPLCTCENGAWVLLMHAKWPIYICAYVGIACFFPLWYYIFFYIIDLLYHYVYLYMYIYFVLNHLDRYICIYSRLCCFDVVHIISLLTSPWRPIWVNCLAIPTVKL